MTLTSSVLVNTSLAKESHIANPNIKRGNEAGKEKRELGEEMLNLRPQDLYIKAMSFWRILPSFKNVKYSLFQDPGDQMLVSF